MNEKGQDMKFQKTNKWLLSGMLTLLVIGLTLALAGCKGEATLEKIELEGYVQDFFVGDEFDTGADFAVWAVYSDGKREQVTEGYTVRQESGMNMYTPGDYMITVEYGGKKQVYTVYVNSDDSTLKKLAVDSGDVKTAFKLGELFDFSGIRIVASYENNSGRTFDIVYTDADLRIFDLTVADSNGNVTKTAFEEFGKHTVTVAYDNVSASYEVDVQGVDLDTVQSAIYVAKYGVRYISGGKLHETVVSAENATTYSDYIYEFGNNYTHILEDVDAGELSTDREYHFSIDKETGTLVNATLENGQMITGNVYTTDMMLGPSFFLWWYTEQANGIEQAIEALYNVAMTDPNLDLTESADVQNRTYRFSFGRKMKLTIQASSRDFFFLTEVEFKLDENYAIVSASMYQSIYPEGFVTDENGHTAPGDGQTPEMATTIVCEQFIGSRTAQNPYELENLLIQDFDLVFNGEKLTDDYVFVADALDRVTITVENIYPASASLEYDRMRFSDSSGYVVYRTGDQIQLTFTGHGSYTLVLSTENVTREIHMVITGRPPEELNSEVYREAFDGFVASEEVTVMAGTPLYFAASPNANANDGYSVFLDGEAAPAPVQTEIGGRKCWMFTADETGTYEIVMTSDVAPEVGCLLTVTVVEQPDLETLLNGSYALTDSENGTYLLTFERNTGTTVCGILTVVYTAADGTEQTQTLRFTLVDSLTVTLEEVSGDSLGVALKVSTEGKLQLEDRYEHTYDLPTE